jgi:hypothetical protein
MEKGYEQREVNQQEVVKETQKIIDKYKPKKTTMGITDPKNAAEAL